MNCNNCRCFNKTGFVPGFGDCVLNREVHSANHEACEHYEEYSKMTRSIDANALFDKVGNIKPKNKSEYELIGKFMNMITNSPTITIPVSELDTTVDFGEWKPYKDSAYSGGGYLMCTKCKYRFSFGAYRILQNDNYCPHCGVKIWKEV